MPLIARGLAIPWAFVCVALAGSAHADASRCLEAYEGGQRSRLAGDLDAARASFRTCSEAACPAIVLRDCAKWLREVEAAIPSVIVSAHDRSGSDLADARVLVDGRVVQERLTGMPIEVTAGEHVFRFERAGSRPHEAKVIVNVGEKNRLVRATLEPLPGESRGSSSIVRALPFVLGGVGLGLVAGGVALDVVGSGELTDLRERCAGRCETAELDATRAKIVAGDVLLGAGIVSVGAAALWLLLRDPIPASAASAPNHADAPWLGGL